MEVLEACAADIAKLRHHLLQYIDESLEAISAAMETRTRLMAFSGWCSAR